MSDTGRAPSSSERRNERAQRPEIPRERISTELAILLRKLAYSPEELFGARAHTLPEKYARDRAEENMRLMLALALEDPINGANLQAVGRAAMVLLHMAMDDTVRERIERGGL